MLLEIHLERYSFFELRGSVHARLALYPETCLGNLYFLHGTHATCSFISKWKSRASTSNYTEELCDLTRHLYKDMSLSTSIELFTIFLEIATINSVDELLQAQSLHLLCGLSLLGPYLCWSQTQNHINVTLPLSTDAAFQFWGIQMRGT